MDEFGIVEKKVEWDKAGLSCTCPDCSLASDNMFCVGGDENDETRIVNETACGGKVGGYLAIVWGGCWTVFGGYLKVVWRVFVGGSLRVC